MNILKIINRYKEQECFSDDLRFDKLEERACSKRDAMSVKRLVDFLKKEHPSQVEFISELEEYLASCEKEKVEVLPQEKKYFPGMKYEIKPDEKVYIHPAANIMPMMPEEQFEAHKADIQKIGLQDPIEMLEGKLLDGRNRLRACQELGIVAHAVEVECANPIDYVFSRNAKRRQLDKNQLAILAVRQKEHLTQGFTPSKKLKTRDFLAKAVGVNPRYIQDALKFKDDEAMLDKVFNGELTLAQAKKVKTPPKKEKPYWGDEVIVSKILEEYPEEKCDTLLDIVPHCKGRVRDAIQKKISIFSKAGLKRKSEEMQHG